MALTIKLFTGDWCPSCRPRTELIGKLCTKYDLNFEPLPLEEHSSKQEAARYHVQKIPMAFVLNEEGNVLVEFGPQTGDHQIRKWLEERMTFDAKSSRRTTEEEGTSDTPRE